MLIRAKKGLWGFIHHVHDILSIRRCKNCCVTPEACIWKGRGKKASKGLARSDDLNMLKNHALHAFVFRFSLWNILEPLVYVTFHMVAKASVLFNIHGFFVRMHVS